MGSERAGNQRVGRRGGASGSPATRLHPTAYMSACPTPPTYPTPKTHRVVLQRQPHAGVLEIPGGQQCTRAEPESWGTAAVGQLRCAQPIWAFKHVLQVPVGVCQEWQHRPANPAPAHQWKKSCSAAPCEKRSLGCASSSSSMWRITALHGRSSSMPPLMSLRWGPHLRRWAWVAGSGSVCSTGSACSQLPSDTHAARPGS